MIGTLLNKIIAVKQVSRSQLSIQIVPMRAKPSLPSGIRKSSLASLCRTHERLHASHEALREADAKAGSIEQAELVNIMQKN